MGGRVGNDPAVFLDFQPQKTMCSFKPYGLRLPLSLREHLRGEMPLSLAN